MTDRERLVELLKIGYRACLNTVEEMADHLLQNGVIVPPCKVGDTVYQQNGERIFKDIIVSIELFGYKVYFNGKWIDFDETAIGTSIFLTREEAEKALKEREKNDI